MYSRAAAWGGYLACKLTRTSLVATVYGRQAVHTSARRFRVFGTHVIAVCEALKTHLVEELGYTISYHKLSFWAAASAQRALAAAVRARPSPLHFKKGLVSKWYDTICNQKPSEWRGVLAAASPGAGRRP